MKQRGVIAEAREAVKKLAEEQQNGYFEVFRRLVTVPTSTFAEVEGDRGLDHSSQAKINFDKGAAYKKLRHLLPLQVTPLACSSQIFDLISRRIFHHLSHTHYLPPFISHLRISYSTLNLTLTL